MTSNNRSKVARVIMPEAALLINAVVHDVNPPCLFPAQSFAQRGDVRLKDS